MKILLIEDDVVLNETIDNYLSMKGNELTTFDDGANAIEVIDKSSFDLYIIDINIPNINGLELVKLIRLNDPDAPIIIITASMELGHFKSAYHLGCDDYLKKPFHLEELEIRINKARDKIIELKLIEQQNKNLEKIASLDPLTEIRNRRSFREIIATEIKRSKRYQHPLCLIYFDIDHFKKINDSYGHRVGDEILIDVVKVVLHQLRDIDYLGRWGGDEFLILLSETSLMYADHVAQRICSEVEQYPFNKVDEVSISLGVVEYKTNESIDALINRADTSLYRAKSNGKNKVMLG
ncbi:MAG: diguanylate cyclase [Gammaproteobacteria bacterium]|nr:diguanylate cyclase [Gammaproteobacteria bacterium]